MNYNTIVTPEVGLTCTAEEADEICDLLAESEDDLHGFTFVFQDGQGYLEAEEVGTWSALPQAVLQKVAALLVRAGLPYLEFGAAFTAGRLVPGSHGGTAFRLMADGGIVERIETWPT